MPAIIPKGPNPPGVKVAQEGIKMFGAYVVNASTSIGWGGQGGSMQFELVEDPDNGVTINMPDVGTPVGFKYGTFEAGGIFQRHTYSESISGGRKYNIVLESPAKMLDGVQCIIEQFLGLTDFFARDANQGFYSTNLGPRGPQNNMFYGDIENVYNLFGYYENPSVGGVYGGSNFNDSGMEVTLILNALDALANGSSRSPYSGPINLNSNYFDLDVSELLGVVNAIWGGGGLTYRLNGRYKSVNQVASEICDAVQYDYFWDIQGKDSRTRREGRGKDGGFVLEGKPGKNPIIKLRIVNKQKQPKENAIKDFIEDGKKSETIVSYSHGKELGDAFTQKVIFGGARTRYQSIPLAACDPIIGKLNGGGYRLAGVGAGAFHAAPNNLVALNLDGIWGGPVYFASLFEIRMALGGRSPWNNFKTFETLAGTEKNGYNNIFTSPWTGTGGVTKDVLNLLVAGAGNNFDATLTNANVWYKDFLKSMNQLGDRIFSAVSGFANNFYCQQYMTPLGGEFTQRNQMEYLPPGEFSPRRSWEVSGSAYVQNPMSFDIAMMDGESKQKSLAGWPLALNYDYSGLGSDYAAGATDFAGTIVSTKGSPDSEMYWDGSNHWVAFNAGTKVKVWDFITTPDFGLTVLASYFFGINIPPDFYFTPNFQGALQFAIPPDAVVPSRFGIPQESTRYNYGPWVTVARKYSPEGKAVVEGVESLRPEKYGGYHNLAQVGAIFATVGAGQMKFDETGSVTVVGKPEGNIGERFAGGGPYLTNVDFSISVDSGITTTYKFNTWTAQFGKLAKYNIDRISKIGKAAWDFAKKQRDKIEKKPLPAFRFEKMDLKDAKKKMKPDVNAINFGLKGGVPKPPKGLGIPGGGKINPNPNADMGAFN